MKKWRARARQLKGLIQALWIASRDSRTPWFARTMAAAVLAYAFSPIDLIPDPIPLLGYLDDLILLPLGIALVIRLIPDQVWTDARAMAAASPWSGKPRSRVGAFAIVALWIGAAVVCWLLVRAWCT